MHPLESYIYWGGVIGVITTISHLEHYSKSTIAEENSPELKLNEKTCRGMYKLVPPEPPKTQIREQLAKGTLIWYDHSVKAYIYGRELYTNYQYYGTGIDSNSYPVKSWRNTFPHLDELSEWIKRGGCKVGRNICGPGDFWGTWSSECLKSSEVLLSTDSQWGGEKIEHECSGSEWIKFPYHTCQISWSCHLHEVSLPIRLDTEGRVYTSLPNGSRLELDKNIYTMGKSSQLYIPELPLRHQSEVLLDCLGGVGPGGLKCILREGPGDLIGSVYSGNVTFVANRRSNILVNLTTLNSTTAERIIVSDKSASLSDLYEVDSLVREVSMRSDLNDFELTKGLIELTGVVTRLLENLSQKDPLLLGKVLESKSSYRTLYTAGGLFTKCFGEAEHAVKGEFCTPEGLTMQSGVPVPWDGTSFCLKPSTEIAYISLLHDIHEIEGLERPASLEGASLQWSIYELVERERSELLESARRVKRYSSALMSDVLENPLNTWYGSIVSLCSISLTTIIMCSLLFLFLLKIVW
ncbi:G protein [Varroa jacobsoni rhabdovirus 2]|nr:G protein [Varroa jacobsoni rhabdovirus 2]